MCKKCVKTTSVFLVGGGVCLFVFGFAFVFSRAVEEKALVHREERCLFFPFLEAFSMFH